MHINSILNIKPIRLDDEDKEVYLTHVVESDDSGVYILLSYYNEEEISVLPAVFTPEKYMVESVSEDIAQAINLYVEANPITVMTYQQVKEAVANG